MAEDKNSEVFTLLQPELLMTDQLVTYLKSRCSTVQNLSSLPRERLVSLFRQVIMPLPQRQCWANRRGKLLTPRRPKSGMEGRHDDVSSRPGAKRLPADGDRLKPAPDSNTPKKIRIRDSASDGIVNNDRAKRDGREAESSSPRRIQMKRSSSGVDQREKCSTDSREPIKKQRTAIRWP